MTLNAKMQSIIPVFRPSYGEEEVEAVRECLMKGWTGCGPKVKEFEEAFARYAGVKYAVATNNCTASLHLALKLLEIEGAEVITTPMTFVSTNHAILYNKGIPVFADICEDNLNIDPESVEKLITPKTKALMAVHYGGHACDMGALLEIARRHNLHVVEDVAHGCGGEYRGRKLGALGTLGCFSFHAVKNMATGDGGMITTQDRNFYERLLKLRWVGISRDTWDRSGQKAYSWDYQVEELGFKYQMNDITAAIGLVQLGKLDVLNQKRADIAAYYDKAFQSPLVPVKPLAVRADTKKAHHNYVVKTEKRDDLMQFLSEKGISTGVHYRPNNHYDLYRECAGETPVAESVWKKIITLPLFPDLSSEERSYIIDSIRAYFC